MFIFYSDLNNVNFMVLLFHKNHPCHLGVIIIPKNIKTFILTLQNLAENLATADDKILESILAEEAST